MRTTDADLQIVQSLIAAECDELRDLLAAKNRAYGNSALDPVRIFSRADPVEQIKVRIDDKLSRLARGLLAGEDVERDLLGYLILLRVARRRAAEVPTGEACPDEAAADAAVVSAAHDAAADSKPSN